MTIRRNAHVKRRAFEVSVKTWVATGSDAGVFGEGKYRLLEAIARCGSLSLAAVENGISYRKAWGEIRKAETRIGRRLVVRKRGGAGGGTSRLTPFTGNRVEAYAAFRKEITASSRRIFRSRLGRFFSQD